ncbi:tetratricopeptide repeat protein [Flavobacterium sp.]|uniref:tetratricopeptide repeat protein n=1 Tax=Flavobacterium sp. TaxID=239 RepID=UPI003751D957
MQNTLFFIISLFSFLISFSQTSDGYWDNIRTTNETITLKAGERKAIKTANFPEGTTEVVYRITLLDDNQKTSSSLVSVLKSIPDPTGISQGAAGAIFLLSTISGDDKCKYYVFINNLYSDNYTKNGKTTNACVIQNTPINKEAKLLSTNATCLSETTENLYFAFESDNWVMNQKIVLEVVPWVNKKASRGWNSITKKELLDIAQKQEVVKYLSNKDQFYGFFIENFTNKYKYSEYKQMLSIEKNKAIVFITEESLKKSGEIEKYYNSIRAKSLQLFKENKIDDAIDLIQTEMIAKNRANYKDYGVLGDYYLFSKQFSKAEDAYNNGLKLNASEINFKLNLAHIYMFTNRLSEAKEIHKKYSNQSLISGKTWIEQVKFDFLEFGKKGFSKDNFKKILRVIE